MTRPRMVAIISAIASSTAAFLVVSHWRLAGTLAGAVVLPVVYSFVSHWSNESLDSLGRWTRSRLGRDSRNKAVDESTVCEAVPQSRPRGGRRVRRSEWLLACFATLALAVSIYSLTTSDSIQRVIFRERVFEKTVTSLVEQSDSRSLAAASLVVDHEEASTLTGEAPGDAASTATGVSAGPGTETPASAVSQPEDEVGEATTASTVEHMSGGEDDGGTSATTDPLQTEQDPGRSAPDTGQTARDPVPASGEDGSSTPPSTP